MKSISKKQCQALIQWKIEQKLSPQNLTYNNAPHKEMKLDLLKEQGYLCAYTMRRIEEDTMHIEHIYPQSIYMDRAIEWTNIVAAYPNTGNISERHDYGADLKADYDPENGFISPINLDVKKHFKFKQDGEIEGLTDEARTTIDVLNLNHEILKNNRHEKIKTAIKEARDATISNVQKRIEQLRQPKAKGEYEEYCEAAAQYLERVLVKKKAMQQNKNNTKKKR